MKFIVLNPHFEDTKISQRLKKLGVHCLFCNDLREVDLVLKIHSDTVQLLIGHDEDGLELNNMIKNSKALSSIPIILSFSKWSQDQCAEHQAGTEKVNAYLRIPVDESEWLKTIDAVLGTDFLSDKSSATSKENEEAIQFSDLSSSGNASEKVENEGIDLGNLFEDVGNDPVLEVSHQQKFDANEISLEGISEESLNQEAIRALPVAKPVLNLENILQDHELDISSDNGSDRSTENSSINDEQNIDFSDISAAINLAPGVSFGSLSDDSPSSAPTLNEREDDVTSPTIETPPPPRRKNILQETSEEVDEDALAQMPYLSSARKKFSQLSSHVPLSDALVPGGTANPPDSETLKKYLSLREMDVATLSQQLQHSKDHIQNLEVELRKEKADNSELSYLAQEQEARIKNFDKEKQIALESAQTENQELKFEMKKRMDKIRLLEIQVREASLEAEKIKDRVRNDIRKIRSREKELENRLEIMRKDSEALLSSRENRIIELKRKLDLIEFNMDILQNQYEKEKQLTVTFKEKLEKAAQVVRMAEGMLHPTEQMDIGDILTQDLNKEDKTRVA